MEDAHIGKKNLLNALRAVGEQLDWHESVQITLVGAAALVLNDLVRKERTTHDCDVISYIPGQAMGAVELAAERVASRLGLNPEWLNSKVQIRLDSIPDGWEQRRVLIDRFNILTVYAASRLDLIAMKVLAHRPQDLEDLRDLCASQEEWCFVESYLENLPAKGTTQQEIDEAYEVVRSMKPQP